MSRKARETIAQIIIKTGQPGGVMVACRNANEVADAILAALPSIIADMVEPLVRVDVSSCSFCLKGAGQTSYFLMQTHEGKIRAYGIQGSCDNAAEFDSEQAAIEAANAHNVASTLKALGMKEGE